VLVTVKALLEEGNPFVCASLWNKRNVAWILCRLLVLSFVGDGTTSRVCLKINHLAFGDILCILSGFDMFV
jgi:hypothetical protein